MGFTRLRLAALVLVAGFVLPQAQPCLADDDNTAKPESSDAQRAERALKGHLSGEFMPFAQLASTAISAAGAGGRVVEVEFKEESSRPVYEFYVLGEDGRLREIYLDARTGEVLRQLVEQ